jgi:hypothetical protein
MFEVEGTMKNPNVRLKGAADGSLKTLRDELAQLKHQMFEKDRLLQQAERKCMILQKEREKALRIGESGGSARDEALQLLEHAKKEADGWKRLYEEAKIQRDRKDTEVQTLQKELRRTEHQASIERNARLEAEAKLQEKPAAGWSQNEPKSPSEGRQPRMVSMGLGGTSAVPSPPAAQAPPGPPAEATPAVTPTLPKRRIANPSSRHDKDWSNEYPEVWNQLGL